MVRPNDSSILSDGIAESETQHGATESGGEIGGCRIGGRVPLCDTEFESERADKIMRRVSPSATLSWN